MYLFFLYRLIMSELTIERYNNSRNDAKKTLKLHFSIEHMYCIYILLYILYIIIIYIYIIYYIISYSM